MVWSPAGQADSPDHTLDVADREDMAHRVGRADTAPEVWRYLGPPR